jgi:hypothetical protein
MLVTGVAGYKYTTGASIGADGALALGVMHVLVK